VAEAGPVRPGGRHRPQFSIFTSEHDIMSAIVETSSRMPASRSDSRHQVFLFGIAVALAAVVGCAVLATMFPTTIDPAPVRGILATVFPGAADPTAAQWVAP
jgi:hypothetical protein